MVLVGYDFVVLVLHSHAYYHQTCITVLNNRHVSLYFFLPLLFYIVFDIKARLIV